MLFSRIAKCRKRNGFYNSTGITDQTFCLRLKLNRCQPENALNRAFTLSGIRDLRYLEPKCISRGVLSRFFFRGTVVGRDESELKRSCAKCCRAPMEVFMKKSNQYSLTTDTVWFSQSTALGVTE